MGNNIRMRIIEFWYHPSYMFGTRLSSPFWYLLQTDKHHTILGHQRMHQWTVNNKAQAQVNSVYIISENWLMFWNQTPADSDLQAENYLLFGSEFGSWGVSANCKKMLRIVLPKSSRRHMLLFRPHSRCGVTSLLVFQVQRDILMLQCAHVQRAMIQWSPWFHSQKLVTMGQVCLWRKPQCQPKSCLNLSWLDVVTNIRTPTRIADCLCSRNQLTFQSICCTLKWEIMSLCKLWFRKKWSLTTAVVEWVRGSAKLYWEFIKSEAAFLSIYRHGILMQILFLQVNSANGSCRKATKQIMIHLATMTSCSRWTRLRIFKARLPAYRNK